MPRSKNVAPTRQITISTGENILKMLASLAERQLYGSNVAEVAEDLMRRKLIELAKEGEVSAPPTGEINWGKEVGDLDKEVK